MNRRAFFRTIVGGVAATTAVRTWPFRVFSFPSEVKVARALPLDLGFNVFDYAGLPMIQSSFCPKGKVFAINDRLNLVHPDTLDNMIREMKAIRFEGVSV